jgi:hypothetical protein
MKLLFDQNLSFKLSQSLAELFPGSRLSRLKTGSADTLPSRAHPGSLPARSNAG